MEILYWIILETLDTSGLAFCIYCNKSVSYKSSGKKDILAHAKKSSHHLRSRKDHCQTTCLPLSCSEPTLSSELRKCSTKSKKFNLPYRITKNVHISSKCPDLQKKSNPVVSLIHHKHLEAYVISFVAENSVPLSSVPTLIEFVRNVSKDHSALSKLKTNIAITSFKFVYGLNFYEQKKSGCNDPFSINIDKCTSNNYQKVVTIHVNYFDEKSCLSVLLYKFVSMIEGNALILFKKICELVQADQTAFENCISDLSDSRNYMRNKKGG